MVAERRRSKQRRRHDEARIDSTRDNCQRTPASIRGTGARAVPLAVGRALQRARTIIDQHERKSHRKSHKKSNKKSHKP